MKEYELYYRIGNTWHKTGFTTQASGEKEAIRKYKNHLSVTCFGYDKHTDFTSYKAKELMRESFDEKLKRLRQKIS